MECEYFPRINLRVTNFGTLADCEMYIFPPIAAMFLALFARHESKVVVMVLRSSPTIFTPRY